MPNFLKPTFDELQYHQNFLNHKKTMDFNHGTVEFPKTQWESFYSTWVDSKSEDKLYQLVFCPGCQDFVGELSLKKINDKTLQAYFLVKYEHRNEGYGQSILERIVASAKADHYDYILIKTFTDNPYISFLTKRGFFIKETSNEQTTLKLIVNESNLDTCCSICSCKAQS